MNQAAKRALFEQTIVPHLDSAYNLARWLTRNEQDAEDVVQESYLRAFRFFDGFRGVDGRPWLLAVVRNTCLTWLRQRKGDLSMVAFDEAAHAPRAAEPNAESRLIEGSKLASLSECIEALPLEFREVLVMRELEEMSYRQISETSGVPVGTVMSRLSRARKRLLECMTARLEGSHNAV